MARKQVQPGFFDLDDRYAALSKIGDPLEQLDASNYLAILVHF